MSAPATPRADRIWTALVVAALGAAAATFVVWIVTLVVGGSFTSAVSKPGFWIAEAATFVVVGLAVYYGGYGAESERNPPGTSTARVVGQAAAWAGATVLIIGVLLSVVTARSFVTVVTSLPFLIAGGIAIAVAALEAWPSDTD